MDLRSWGWADRDLSGRYPITWSFLANMLTEGKALFIYLWLALDGENRMRDRLFLSGIGIVSFLVLLSVEFILLGAARVLGQCPTIDGASRKRRRTT